MRGRESASAAPATGDLDRHASHDERKQHGDRHHRRQNPRRRAVESSDDAGPQQDAGNGPAQGQQEHDQRPAAGERTTGHARNSSQPRRISPSVGMVERIREIGGEKTCEIAFHLCSIPANARTYARAARGHWAIENALHWSLDVTFGEDQSRVRAGYAAENLNILRHITLNLLKRDTTKKLGIKSKQKSAGWDHTYLLSLLAF